MAEQRHAGTEPGSRRPLGQGLGRWDKTGADAVAADNTTKFGVWPVLAHRGARSDPAIAGAGAVTGTVDAGRGADIRNAVGTRPKGVRGVEGLARRLAFGSNRRVSPGAVKVSVEFNLVVHLVLKLKAVCAAVTAAVQSAWSDLSQANEELVESGLADVTARKGRLVGQPGVTEGVRSSLSAGSRRAEMGRCGIHPVRDQRVCASYRMDGTPHSGLYLAKRMEWRLGWNAHVVQHGGYQDNGKTARESASDTRCA